MTNVAQLTIMWAECFGYFGHFVNMTQQKYVGEVMSALSVRVILMTYLSSVSMITLMRRYCHLFPLSLSLHTHATKPSFYLKIINPHAHYPFFLLEKLFGKRLLQARRYIMSRKSWLKMVPTENCDILMTFPGMTCRLCLLCGGDFAIVQEGGRLLTQGLNLFVSPICRSRTVYTGCHT